MVSGSGHTRILRTFAARLFLLSAVFGCLFLLGALSPLARGSSQPLRGIWVTAEHSLSYIDPDTNAITRRISLRNEIRSLAVSPAMRGVWLLAEHQLLRYDPDLNLVQQLDLRSIPDAHDEPQAVLCDVHDSTLWIAGEKTLVHVDAAGQQIGAAKLDAKIRAVVLDLDGSLWILTGRRLLHISVSGATLSSLKIDALRGEPRLLALDRLGNRIWVTDGKQVLRLDTANPTLMPIVLEPAIASPGEPNHDGAAIDALRVHPVFGTLWIANRENLWIYDRQGQPLRQVAVAPYDLGEIERLVFDPVDYGLWLGGEKAIGRFQSNGDFIARVSLPEKLDDMAASPFRLVPTLSLVTPADNTFTNNAFTPLRYRLGADCTGTPCLLDPDYTRTFQLDASLNGMAVGSLFALTADEATYSPLARLPEGMNSVSIQATDRFGHSSDKLTSHFTVDTIPPRFLAVSPADGSTVNGFDVTIEGRVDDPAASVQLIDDAGAMISMAGTPFAFLTNLKPGWNPLTLVTRDLAGNAASTSLRLYRSGLDAVITSFIPGSVVDTDSLNVSGTYTGAENTGITINGVVALTDAQNFYVNNLPLTAGLNTLTITMTGPDGKVVTKSVTVTSSGPAAFQASVEPQSGIAPLKVRFSGRLRDDSSITSLSLDADGDGSVDLVTAGSGTSPEFSYDTPGMYRPKLVAVDSQGRSYEQTLAVRVRDPAEADEFFAHLWNGMNDSLRRGDMSAALTYLNTTAKAKYTPVFQTLLPQMPSIIASYSPPTRLSVTESIGEYAITRPYQGATRVYLIYFLQDADGVWRIDEM